ncbi:MAG: hypothetical protein K0M48_12280 [Thiobacillus sp.]|nr:hypothetical protein [Thiobacillus sp.]
MNTRKTWIFGMAALGLALAAPVHAAPDFIDGAFIVAKRDRADEVRPDPRDARRDDRRANRRDARDEPQGYGYGYERRQQKRFEEDDRNRGRR